MDAGAFGGGVKTVIAYQDPGFQEVVVEFVHVGHELGIGGCAFVFGVFRGFDDDHESHFVCPFGLSWSSTPRGNMAREPGVPVSHKAVTASSGHSGGSFRTVRLAALNLRAGHLRLSS